MIAVTVTATNGAGRSNFSNQVSTRTRELGTYVHNIESMPITICVYVGTYACACYIMYINIIKYI